MSSEAELLQLDNFAPYHASCSDPRSRSLHVTTIDDVCSAAAAAVVAMVRKGQPRGTGASD